MQTKKCAHPQQANGGAVVTGVRRRHRHVKADDARYFAWVSVSPVNGLQCRHGMRHQHIGGLLACRGQRSAVLLHHRGDIPRKGTVIRIAIAEFFNDRHPVTCRQRCIKHLVLVNGGRHARAGKQYHRGAVTAALLALRIHIHVVTVYHDPLPHRLDLPRLPHKAQVMVCRKQQ
ncbi:hypothetical protein SDC9_150401 [bioreactor metagenome]|uniref:Uncharacterized protein n=1 Tax=bioreactor metagenome TaxID=1076179 RepID=A0A645EP05_9ZZZZ